MIKKRATMIRYLTLRVGELERRVEELEERLADAERQSARGGLVG